MCKEERGEVGKGYVGGGNEREKAMWEVWEDFMGMEEVGIEDF